jgi:hypothetical protein
MERNGVPETLIRLGYIYPVLSLRIISGVVCGNMAGSRSPSWARPEECTEYVGRAVVCTTFTAHCLTQIYMLKYNISYILQTIRVLCLCARLTASNLLMKRTRRLP